MTNTKVTNQTCILYKRLTQNQRFWSPAYGCLLMLKYITEIMTYPQFMKVHNFLCIIKNLLFISFDKCLNLIKSKGVVDIVSFSYSIPICNKPENGFLAKFIAVTMGSFVILIIVITSIGVFGTDHASIMVNPGLQLTKYIQLGNFFERVEIIWMSIAVGAGIMTGASLILASSLGISQVVELSSYKPLVYPVVLISFALSITSFESDNAALRFIFYSYPFLAIFVQSGLELFLFVVALLLKKRGSAT